jgi:hypothetical protein
VTRFRIAVLAAIAVGVTLRVWQYLGRDSFFLDEIAVLRNVVERPWPSLLAQPLAYDQVAPPGFLLTEKLIVSAGGVTEYTARIFPLLCSIAAVAVFARLARRLLSKPAALAALIMFATTAPLIVFAAQVKQFSTDVLATCTLLLWATRCMTERSPRAYCAFGISAVLLPLFSQVTVFVLCGVGVVLLLEEAHRFFRGEGETSRILLAVLSIAAVSACSAFLFAQHRLTAGTMLYQHQFWADAFPPHDFAAWLHRPWPYPQARGLFEAQASAPAYPAPGAFLFMALSGLLLLGTGQPKGRLVAAPVLVTLAAAGAGLYPFAWRPILFLFPCLFLAIARAGEALGGMLGRVWRHATCCVPLAIAAVACLSVVRTPPTYHREPLRPVVESVAARRRPGEKVYVYYGMIPAFWYYGPRSGLVDASVIAGGCHRGDSRQYLREVDALRGSARAFVIIGHSLSGEREEILRYLDAIGTNRSEVDPRPYVPHPGLVDAYEYDLSDEQKLRAASADTFHLKRPVSSDPVFTCDRGPVSMARSGPGTQ